MDAESVEGWDAIEVELESSCLVRDALLLLEATRRQAVEPSSGLTESWDSGGARIQGLG